MQGSESALCLECGYDLRASTGDRCPECGAWFDVTGALTPTLPWAHRRRIGRVRGYLKTVVVLTRRPGRLCDELQRTVDLSTARSFRQITVVVVFLSLAVTAYIARRDWLDRLRGESFDSFTYALRNTFDGYEILMGILMWRVSFWLSLIALLLSLFSMTATAGWFVRTRAMDTARWNRSAALAHYTCAPLALMPLAVLFSWGLYSLVDWMMRTWWTIYELYDLSRLGMIVGLPLVLIAVWLVLILRLVQRTTGCGKGRILLLAATLPLIWIAIAIFIFASVHGVATFLILPFRRA